MAVSPASGEVFHFPVTDYAVSPVPGFVLGHQSCALVLKPGPPHRGVKMQPLNIAFNPQYILQSSCSHGVPAYVFALYFLQLQVLLSAFELND